MVPGRTYWFMPVSLPLPPDQITPELNSLSYRSLNPCSSTLGSSVCLRVIEDDRPGPELGCKTYGEVLASTSRQDVTPARDIPKSSELQVWGFKARSLAFSRKSGEVMGQLKCTLSTHAESQKVLVCWSSVWSPLTSEPLPRF